jgi:ATP-dependent RNA helicase DeaD
LELTRASLEEAILEGDLDGFRVVVETLAEEYDLLDVAAAAVRLAHQAEAGPSAAEEEIPSVTAPRRDDREDGVRQRGRDSRSTMTKRGSKHRRSADVEVTRVYIGVGRKGGIRPRDLVGAIANEAGIDSGAIGAIEIADRFSLVEVPEDAAETIIEALRATTIRGKRVTVRRDRES